MSPVVRTGRSRDAPKPTQSKSAQAQELARRRYRRTRRLIRAGQALMVFAALLALEHVAAHLGIFGGKQPSGLVDLVAGWPLAALLAIMGAILAGQRQ